MRVRCAAFIFVKMKLLFFCFSLRPGYCLAANWASRVHSMYACKSTRVGHKESNVVENSPLLRFVRPTLPTGRQNAFSFGYGDLRWAGRGGRARLGGGRLRPGHFYSSKSP